MATSALWYEKPAEDWNWALPIGNGRLGAMVFGGVSREVLQLNEDSVWYGGPRNRNNPDAQKYLPEIRRLLMDGQVAEAEQLAVLALTGVPESQRHYQPLGDLVLDFDYSEEIQLKDRSPLGLPPQAEFTHYRRELDLDKALVTVSYRVNGVGYTRTLFASAVDQVITVRLSADTPGKLTFNAHFERERRLDATQALKDHGLLMTGSCGGKGAVSFCAGVSALCQGGNISTIGDTLRVEKADSVLLLISGNTSFRHKRYKDVCIKQMKQALAKGYTRLYQDHVVDYGSLFHRVHFELGSPEDTETSLEHLPTHERLERVKHGEQDLDLVSLYFQYGRYLLIASSRPGSLPANLQGLWNKDFHPPWGSKYTININTQMNYWPAEVCHLAECHLPLFDLIERMREPGRVTAREMYNCRGFVAHHNTDIWADTAPQDVWIPATYWPMGAAWLCLHLWEHYLFNLDKNFLTRAYPIMREAAEFFVDFLIENEKGYLVTCPSLSPENVYRLDNGQEGCLCAGNAMDSQILHELFSACIEAAEILKVDEAFTATLSTMRSKLPKTAIGRHGQIREWLEDYEEPEPGHRHISQLFALYPGHMISWEKNPELAQAAIRTLERRLAHGGGHTGWSRAWIINHWARLKEGEKAWENILALLKHSTLPNLFDNHPPFQIDGNFGGTAGIAEMLLQSWDNEIEILPALPRTWSEGVIHGLRARGGLIVDMEWQRGKLVKASLLATQERRVKIKYEAYCLDVRLPSQKRVTLNFAMDRGLGILEE